MDDISSEIWGIIMVSATVWAIFHFLGWRSNEDKLREALQQANIQIEFCNQQINNAKDRLWQDYNTMAYAISTMNYCNEVFDPTKK